MASSVTTCLAAEKPKLTKMCCINSGGCSRTVGGRQTSFPPSYTTNSKQELECLKYASTFREEFKRCYPNRRQLFLSALNESGVNKLLCSTLQPSRQPSVEMYDLEGCVQFVAHYLKYKSPENPQSIPSCLPSPGFVLDQGSGNSFDFSTLLCSILLGSGFDAYVCYGTVPSFIALRDQSLQLCPQFYIEATSMPSPLTEIMGDDCNNQTTLKRRKDTETQQLKMCYQTVKRDELTEQHVNSYETDNEEPVVYYPKSLKKTEDEEYVDSDMTDDEDDHSIISNSDDDVSRTQNDEYLHMWIVVREGRRDIRSTLCIDACTGCIFEARNFPYLKVEAIINHKQFWVNMQDSKKRNIAYDITNTTEWKPVFTNQNIMVEEEGDVMAVSPPPSNRRNDENETKMIFNHLPSSWVKKLHITPLQLTNRYPPYGMRTLFYKRSMVELLSTSFNEMSATRSDEGLTARVSIFKDLSRTVAKDISEAFENRADRLYRRKRLPLLGEFWEFFLPGRPDGLQWIHECLGSQTEMGFYHDSWHGLNYRIEETNRKIVERFKDRIDRIRYRQIDLTRIQESNNKRQPPSNYILPGKEDGSCSDQSSIDKITEKYEREQTSEESEYLAKRTFNVNEAQIINVYRHVDGTISRSETCQLKRCSNSGDNGYLVTHKQNEEGHDDTSESCSENEIAELVLAEKECYAEACRLHLDMLEIRDLRLKEEMNPQTNLPVWM